VAATSLTFSNGTIIASGTCTVTVDVTATTSGDKVNTSSVVTSIEGGPGNSASDTLTVLAPPSISKNFTPNPIAAGGISTLTFTINNPNLGTVMTGVAYTDNLPAGLEVATAPNASNSNCGTPTWSPSATGTTLDFSGGTIAAGGTCTASVDVTAASGGTYDNTSGIVSSTNAGTGNAASDSLLVSAAIIIDPAVTKTGDPTTAQVGDTVTFTLNVFNNGTADATNVVVTDPLPAFLDYVGVSAPGATSTAYDLPTNTVTITYAIVQPSDFFTITITTQVNALGSPPGGTNTVDLVSGSADSDPTNNVDSTPITIVVVSDLPSPETGYAPGIKTEIPVQSRESFYAQYENITLRIPALGVAAPVVGVPMSETGWDVTWLWNQIGYLDGTAFPGWEGNSVLTSHVYLPNGLPGPFVNLKQLRWGERVILDSYGTRYTYEVRENSLVSPTDPRILDHEDNTWLTLLTCQGYDDDLGTYRWRRVVKAVLIAVE
jgi:LPXTG-site transpeptidase (sortase) family protein